MSFRHVILSIFTFAMASVAVAAPDWDEQNQLKELTYPEIERALEVLRNGPRVSSKCDPDIQHECSFSSFCRSIKDREKSIYLYENSEGRRIPNIALLGVYNALAECGIGLTYPPLQKDPFLYPEMLLEKKHSQAWKKEIPRVTKIYRETKDRLIQVLEAKKNGTNDKQIDNMIQRVQTVTFKLPDVDTFEQLVANGCELPNAYYYPSAHTFTICPQFANFPDASIMSTMAHELGHAIDPCFCAQDLMKTPEGKYVTDYAYDGVALNHVSRTVGEKILPGVPLNQNPLGSVMNCLQSPSSIGIKVPTAKEIQAQYQKDGKQDHNPAFRKFAKDIPQLYQRYGACEGFTENGQMGEAFSDWVSGEVLAHKLKDMRPAGKAQQFAFESQAAFLGSKCPGGLAAVQERAQDAMGFGGGPACGAAFKDYESMASLSKVHPVSPDRMTKIIYAQPEIQKALGCKPGNYQSCK